MLIKWVDFCKWVCVGGGPAIKKTLSHWGRLFKSVRIMGALLRLIEAKEVPKKRCVTLDFDENMLKLIIIVINVHAYIQSDLER